MEPNLEETIVKDFITSSPTGAATDADAPPTCAIFENAADAPMATPIVTKRTGLMGHYRVSIACLAADGFEADKSYNVVVSATIGGVVASSCILTFQVRNIASAIAKLNTMLQAAGEVYQFTPTAVAQASGNPSRPYMVYFDNASPTKATLTFQRGDRGIGLQETLRYANGVPIDLSGCIVRFQLVPITGGAAIVDSAASVVFGNGGVAYYELTEADLSVADTYYRRWVVTDINGNVVTYPAIDNLTVVIHD